jgi:hypothetical protein
LYGQWEHAMKKMNLWMSVVLGFVAVVPLVRAEHEVFVPANDVSFTLSSERTTYTVGDKIVLKYKIRNVSNAALFAPRSVWTVECPPKPHVWAWFEDSSGKHFRGGYAGSCSSTPSSIAERMKTDAVLLMPMQEIEGTFVLADVFGGLKPGTYRIEASLDGWRDTDFTQAQRAELADMAHPFLNGEAVASIAIKLQQK